MSDKPGWLEVGQPVAVREIGGRVLGLPTVERFTKTRVVLDTGEWFPLDRLEKSTGRWSPMRELADPNDLTVVRALARQQSVALIHRIFDGRALKDPAAVAAIARRLAEKLEALS